MSIRASRSVSASILVTVLLTAALFIFLAPIPTDSNTLRRVLRLARAPAQSLVIVGNSVIDHRSKCDADQRTIAEMLGGFSRRPVVDMSFGGQNFATSLGLAGSALRHPRVSGVVLPVSLGAFSAGSSLDARSEGFFRLAAGDYSSFDLLERIRRLEPITAAPPPEAQSFVYRGRKFPDYNGIKASFFNKQVLAAGCPETMGTDPAFVEALYWNQNLRLPIDQHRVADIVRLADEAARRGKSFTVVLMPYDAGDMAALNAQLLDRVRVRQQRIRQGLTAAGVVLVDLAEEIPAADFADRWCACGHLQEAGRTTVAQAVAGRIS